MLRFLVLLILFNLCLGSMKFVSCGTDDEEEGIKCCVARYKNSKKPFCANDKTDDPTKQCLPELCTENVWIKEVNQTSCLDKFLSGNPKNRGHCTIIYENECKCFF